MEYLTENWAKVAAAAAVFVLAMVDIRTPRAADAKSGWARLALGVLAALNVLGYVPRAILHAATPTGPAALKFPPLDLWKQPDNPHGDSTARKDGKQ